MKTRLSTAFVIGLGTAALAFAGPSGPADRAQIQEKRTLRTLTVKPVLEVRFEPASPTNRDKIVFTAVPNDPSAVKRIEFWLNARKIGEASSAPWTFGGGPYAVGVHTIGVVSFDASGKKLASKYTSLRIKEAPLDLTFEVSPRSPTNRDMVTVKAVIPVQRNIRSMVFYLDAVKVGEDKTYPWEFKGGPYPAKTYTFGAEAYDITGNSVGRKYSPLEIKFFPVEIVVSHSPPKPTPADRITFTAEASDRTDIAKVEFFVNARSVGEDSDYPWKVTAGPFPEGRITYGIIIYDKEGRKQGSTYAGCRIE